MNCSLHFVARRGVRQMAHPITTMRWHLPASASVHHTFQRDNPFWEQKLSEGKFMLQDPLRDRPDWTFLDGRPTPLNEQQLKLKMEQIELAKDIVRSLQELKEAEKEHEQHLKEEQLAFQAAQRMKPRAKGSNHPRVRSKS